MPHGVNGNLLTNAERTPKKVKETASKAGVASGEAKRKKKERRNIFQDVLSGTYKDKHGSEVTGEELLIRGIAVNLSDPKSRNWLGTVKLISESLGLTLTEDARKKAEAEIKKIKAETELTEEKTKALRGVKDGVALIEDDDLTRALEAVAAEMEQRNGDE